MDFTLKELLYMIDCIRTIRKEKEKRLRESLSRHASATEIWITRDKDPEIIKLSEMERRIGENVQDLIDKE